MSCALGKPQLDAIMLVIQLVSVLESILPVATATMHFNFKYLRSQKDLAQ